MQWRDPAALGLSGGWLDQPILLAIFAASLLMWTLILERYLYLWWRFPAIRSALLARWEAHALHDPMARRLSRQRLIAQQARGLRRGLAMIRVLVMILPLLGLLGTVSGMGLTFATLGVAGSVEADLGVGISRALTSTLAGLFLALPGLYFNASLQRQAQAALAGLASRLAH